MLIKRALINEFLTGYGLILALALAVLALVSVHGASLLNYGFPLLATVIGGALIKTRRATYAAYVWWIWLFTPLVRRLVDYQSSYHDISPVMVTPLLVTGFALLTIFLHPRYLLRRQMTPFLLFFLALVMALIVGIVTNGLLPALFDFANWLLPPCFAVFIMTHPKDFQQIQNELLFAIILGLILIAGYGLYQFYRVPAWDAYWISASQFKTAGIAADEQLHLFGPLNSPGPYAVVLMASLIFVLVAKGPARLLAGGLGFPAFGLTLVRSAWGAWALAALFVAWRVGGKTRLRILGAGMLIAVTAVPLLSVGPVADIIAQRFATFSNLQSDTSFDDRIALYERTAASALEQPVGTGLGQLGLASKLVNGSDKNFDSGLLLIPFEFGWIGGGLIIWSIGALVIRVLTRQSANENKISIAGAGLFLAMVSQNIFASTFAGVLGLSLWMGVALALGSAWAPSQDAAYAVGQPGLAWRRRPA